MVDDDELSARLAERVLKQDFDVEVHGTGSSALRVLRGEREVDLVLLDIQLPDADGIDILREIKYARPDTQVLMITAYATIERAVEAMRLGAFDFLPKVEDVDLVLIRARRALEQRRLTRKARSLDARTLEESSFSEIVGQSRRMREVFALIESVAPSTSTVLIQGESGTGKELVARAIHSRSPRRDREFLAVNCAAITESLLESELFGHVKGAFTGALRDKRGLFEAAGGGTLFLDEIGDMPPSVQVKLLRAIQEGEVRPVGATSNLRVDVRIVAATNRDLRSAMEKGQFREDLYYRLSVIDVDLPPLRERRDDIPMLAYYFLRKYARKLGREVPSLEPGCLELICGYQWPGNVRELENVIERAVLLSPAGAVAASSLPPTLFKGYQADVDGGTSDASMPFKEAKSLAMTDFERRYVSTLLEQHGGNISRAARQAGLDRSNFKKILRRYDISAGNDQES